MRKAIGTEMKKIICLILVLVCSFSLFACKNDADALIEVVNSSSPTKITTLTYFTAGSDTLQGSFVSTINEDGSTLEYSYQQYADPTDLSEDRIITKSGTVYNKDGKYSTDGETWYVEAPDASLANVTFNLNLKNLGEYELSTDKRTLIAVLTCEEAKAVLGVNISANEEEGIVLVVEINGTKIVKASVSYVTAQAEVVIETSYEYLPIQHEIEVE